MNNEYSSITNTDIPCLCSCHRKGHTNMHQEPCCSITYKKYINLDGTMDWAAYTYHKKTEQTKKNKDFIFKTSKGICKGVYDEETGQVHISEGSVNLLESLYVIEHYNNPFKLETNLQQETTWIKIELDDPHYGYPEYEIEWL